MLADSTDSAALPAGLSYYAGYTNGRYANDGPIRSRFPGAVVLAIDVLNAGVGQVLDVETGDAVPADAHGWAAARIGRGVARPIIYASLDIHETRIAPGPFLRWTAHWTGRPHVCSPTACGSTITADLTQYDDKGPAGEHYDRSQLSPAFTAAYPVPAPPPAPAPPPSSTWSLTVRNIDLSHVTANPLTFVRGPGVRPLQLLLRQYAVPQLVADGVGGPATSAALAAYQARARLVQDRIAGPATFSSLLGQA